MTLQADPTVRLLEDLVSIDSVNPSLVSGAHGEEEIARRIADEVHRGRPHRRRYRGRFRPPERRRCARGTSAWDPR